MWRLSRASNVYIVCVKGVGAVCRPHATPFVIDGNSIGTYTASDIVLEIIKTNRIPGIKHYKHVIYAFIT